MDFYNTSMTNNDGIGVGVEHTDSVWIKLQKIRRTILCQEREKKFRN